MKYLTLLLSLVASQALAQSQPFQHEISGSGSYSSLEQGGTRVKVSAWNLAYGYFLSSQLVGTVGLMRTAVDVNGADADSTDIEVGAKYYLNPNLRRGSFVPFVDGALGIVDASGDDSDLKIRLGVGGAYFINDSVSVDPSLSYMRISTDPRTTGWLFGLRLTVRF